MEERAVFRDTIESVVTINAVVSTTAKSSRKDYYGTDSEIPAPYLPEFLNFSSVQGLPTQKFVPFMFVLN